MKLKMPQTMEFLENVGRDYPLLKMVMKSDLLQRAIEAELHRLAQWDLCSSYDENNVADHSVSLLFGDSDCIIGCKIHLFLDDDFTIDLKIYFGAGLNHAEQENHDKTWEEILDAA
ncbi:hypothetical protein [Paracoccus sp. (in: a-proteobacteria)]|uniref:hypothetical protein n=1 Tax=Paracoccus sp. TaxID=267 RepID=UPI0040594462